jgi:hypothetical protein
VSLDPKGGFAAAGAQYWHARLDEKRHANKVRQGASKGWYFNGLYGLQAHRPERRDLERVLWFYDSRAHECQKRFCQVILQVLRMSQ